MICNFDLLWAMTKASRVEGVSEIVSRADYDQTREAFHTEMEVLIEARPPVTSNFCISVVHTDRGGDMSIDLGRFMARGVYSSRKESAEVDRL